jgi:hypothetical protein
MKTLMIKPTVNRLKLVVYILLLITLLLSNITPIFASSPSVQLYENYTTGGNANSNHISGAKWVGQTFTVTGLNNGSPSVSHTISNIYLSLERVGTTPGTVTVAIQATSSGLPVAPDLASGTLDGNLFNTSYSLMNFTLTSPISVDSGTQYAIIVRAISGNDTDNYVMLQQNSAGGYGTETIVNTSNSGLTWTAGATDGIFQIYGHSLLSIDPAVDSRVTSANVFNNYMVDSNGDHTINDILITVNYINEYTPQYPNQIAGQFFSLQLLDTDNSTILASDPIPSWGDSPASIYIGPTQAIQLQQGAAYYVRLYGNFTGNPSIEYQLKKGDWQGSNLNKLDEWCIRTANLMGTYYNTSYVVFIPRPKTLWILPNGMSAALNQQAGAIFDNAIPGLSTVRPNLFQTLVGLIQYNAQGFVNAFQSSSAQENWATVESNVGPGIAQAATSAGNALGLDPKSLLVFAFLFIYALFAFWLINANQMAIALVGAFPWVMWGVYLGIIDVIVIGTIAAIAALYIVWHFWFTRVI